MSNEFILVKSRSPLQRHVWENRSKFETVQFMVGIVLTILLPQLIMCVYGGLIVALLFCGTGLLGAGAGLIKYWRTPETTALSLGHSNTPSNPSLSSEKRGQRTLEWLPFGMEHWPIGNG